MNIEIINNFEGFIRPIRLQILLDISLKLVFDYKFQLLFTIRYFLISNLSSLLLGLKTNYN